MLQTTQYGVSGRALCNAGCYCKVKVWISRNEVTNKWLVVCGVLQRLAPLHDGAVSGPHRP